MTVSPRGLRPRAPSSPGSLAVARSTHPRGLRPRAPSSPGSLAVARSTGQELGSCQELGSGEELRS
jgi:hypothetical protein